MKSLKILMITLLALLMAGCTVEAPEHPTKLVEPTGEALFANYVSIGNSLTAGFMDGGLMMTGQLTSYPRLIAGQFGLDNSVGDSDFSQPYILSPGVGSSAASPGHAAGVLYFNGSGLSVLGETPLEAVPTLLLAGALPTPYHNLGVPGATLHDVMNAYDAASSASGANSYFNFINRATFFGNETVPAVPNVSPAYETASMFRQAVAKGPSLLTCWIGNNDILGAATSGNPNVDVPITDPAVFQAEYTALLQSLAGGLFQRNGFPSTIVVANIPDIDDIPYFLTEATFELANGGAWSGGYEEADVQLVLFPAVSWADTADPGTPMPSSLTLTTAEVTLVSGAVTAFNGIIAAVATAVDASDFATCGVFDANALMAGLTTAERTHFLMLLPGMGGDIEMAAATTRFSLDGIHPNNHGYGLVANGFIAKINELAGTSVADVNVDALTWDPTYGISIPGKSESNADTDLHQSMRNLFR